MGGDEPTLAAVRIPPAFPSSATTIRFLSLLKRTESGSGAGPDRLQELDEDDVFWSSAYDTPPTAPPPPPAAAEPFSPSSSPHSSGAASYSSSAGRPHRPFLPEKFGLSAALAEEGSPTVRRGAGTPVAVPSPPRRAESVLAAHQSAPVNVPAWPKGGRRRRAFEDSVEEVAATEGRGGDVEKEEEEEEWVPPHVMVARSHVMTFSVVEGVGRTLKGRDLRRVRNAIWQQTGFLD